MNFLKEKLERIEHLLLSNKEIFNVADLCVYTGLSRSAIYKLTDENKIPHSKPNGKVIFFDKKAVDKYLMSKPIKTIDDINQESINYSIQKSLKGAGSW